MDLPARMLASIGESFGATRRRLAPIVAFSGQHVYWTKVEVNGDE